MQSINSILPIRKILLEWVVEQCNTAPHTSDCLVNLQTRLYALSFTPIQGSPRLIIDQLGKCDVLKPVSKPHGMLQMKMHLRDRTIATTS
jgi:hypothetical protein